MSLVGAGLVLAGVLLLWLVWQLGPRWPAACRRFARVFAWALLVLSAWPWAIVAGADRGPALALLGTMGTGLVVVAGIGWRHWRQRPARPPRSRSRNDKDRGRSISGMTARALFLRRAWIVLLAGPLAGAASCLGALAIDRLLASWASANRVTTVLLAVPLVWTLLAILATYGMSLVRRSAAIGLLIALGAAGLFLVHPAGP